MPYLWRPARSPIAEKSSRKSVVLLLKKILSAWHRGDVYLAGGSCSMCIPVKGSGSQKGGSGAFAQGRGAAEKIRGRGGAKRKKALMTHAPLAAPFYRYVHVLSKSTITHDLHGSTEGHGNDHRCKETKTADQTLLRKSFHFVTRFLHTRRDFFCRPKTFFESCS